VEHICGNHWIVVVADFNKHTVHMGDSLPGSHTQILKGALQYFINEVTGQIFSIGKKLYTPSQNDTFSCGVCVISMIQYALFSAPLWTHLMREIFRTEMFILVAR